MEHKQKKAARLEQLTLHEQDEYKYAQHPSLQKYYNSNIGLNDELIQDNSVRTDAFQNPHGSEFDLGKDNSFIDYTILIGNFVGSGANMSNPKTSLSKKGFQVMEVFDEAKFISSLQKADVVWIISGTDPDPKIKTPTSSGEHYPAWKTSNKNEFQEAILKFHNEGGGLYIWGDNDPLFEHANAAMQVLFDDPECVLVGNTPGNNVLSVGNGSQRQQFSPHIITTGIVNLYEGVTICYPQKTNKLKILATSSDGFPVIVYADNEIFTQVNRGRVLIDSGYTKNYISWDQAGTARYIINASVWLLGLEHKLKNGLSLEGRKHRN